MVESDNVVELLKYYWLLTAVVYQIATSKTTVKLRFGAVTVMNKNTRQVEDFP